MMAGSGRWWVRDGDGKWTVVGSGKRCEVGGGGPRTAAQQRRCDAEQQKHRSQISTQRPYRLHSGLLDYGLTGAEISASVRTIELQSHGNGRVYEGYCDSSTRLGTAPDDEG